MVNCPDCDGVMDVDEDELDEGDVLSCDDCGAEIKVVSLDPLELELADDLDEDDEDEDEDDDDSLDDDDEDEDEDEDDS